MRLSSFRIAFAVLLAGILSACLHTQHSNMPTGAAAPYREVSVLVSEGGGHPTEGNAVRRPDTAVKGKVTYAAQTDGEIRPVEDAKLLEVRVDPPDDSGHIRGAADQARMEIASGSRGVTSAAASGGLRIARASSVIGFASLDGRLPMPAFVSYLETHRMRETVSVKAQGTTLARSNVHGTMAIRRGEQTLGQLDMETEMSVQSQGKTLTISGERAAMQIEQDRDFAGRKQQISHQSEIVEGELTLDRAVTLLAFERVGLGVQKRIQLLAEFGSMSGLTDLGDLTMLDDTAILQMLDELGLKPGIWDEHDRAVTCEDSPVITGRLIAQLIADMRKDGTIQKFSGGQASLLFTPRDTGMADLSMQAIGKQRDEKHYHGGNLIIALRIHNSGTVPLDQLYCFLPMPGHTQFNRFLQEEMLGFASSYLPDERLIFWKLYCKLEPGHTFKSVFVLDLDEWKL